MIFSTLSSFLLFSFFSAASFGNPECIELLLKHLASIDQTDADGMTPFLCAVATGHTNCAKMLLESGADIAVRDRYQRCCVHLAVQNEKEDVLKMLLQRSGSGLCNVPDMHERTALHYAVLSSETGVRDKITCRYKSIWKIQHPILNCKCMKESSVLLSRVLTFTSVVCN